MKTFKEYLEEMIGRNLEEARGLEKLSRKFIPGYAKDKIRKKEDESDRKENKLSDKITHKGKKTTDSDYIKLSRQNKHTNRLSRLGSGFKPFHRSKSSVGGGKIVHDVKSGRSEQEIK